MKCRHCGINYDDADKECPICGTKTGTGSHTSSQMYTSYNHKEGDGDCTHQSYDQRVNDTETLLNGHSTRKKVLPSKSVGTIIAVIMVLIAIAPIVFDAIGSILPHSYEAAAPMPEPQMFGEDGFVNFPLLEGDWVSAAPSSTQTLSLMVGQDDMYSLLATGDGWSIESTGYVYLWLNDATEDWHSDTLSPDEYDCYTLNLESESLKTDGAPVDAFMQLMDEDSNIWMLLYEKKDGSGYFLQDPYMEYAPLFSQQPQELSRVKGG